MINDYSAQDFHPVFNAIPVPLAIHDSLGNMIFLNRAFEETFGYTIRDIPTLEVWWPTAYPDPEYRQRLANIWQEYTEEAKRTGKPLTPMEAEIRCRDGSFRTVSCSAAPLGDFSAGSQLAILYDITDKKRAEEELRMTRVSVEAASDAIYWVTPEARFIDANPAASRILGYTREELLKMSVGDIDPYYNDESWQRYFEELRQQGHNKIETVNRAKDGNLIPIEVVGNYVCFGDKEFVCSFCRDISDRKHTEEALQEREQRLSFYLDNSPMASIEWDADFKVSHWSGEAEKIFGWTAAEMVGRAIMDLNIIYADDIPQVTRVVAELIEGTEKYVLSANRNYTKEGRVISCEWFNTILRNRDGQLIAVLSQVMDVTERNRIEEQLRKSESKFRSLNETLMDAFVSVDMSGRILEFNSAYRNLLGYTEDELRTKTYIDLTPTKWHDLEAQILAEQIIPYGYSAVYEKEYIRKDGTIVPIELRTSLVRSATGEPEFMWAIIRDITQRKLMEEALRKSEERYRAIVECQTEFVNRYLPGGIMTYVNPALARWFGFKAEDLVGKSFYPFIREEERQETIQKIEALSCDNPVVQIEQQVYSPDGRLCWHLWTNYALCDEQGRVTEYQSVGIDITEKKEVELYLENAKETLEREVQERTASLTLANELLTREIDERKRIEQYLLDHQRRLEEMSMELSLAADRERERIAGELHDEVGQRLILSRIKLDALASQLSDLEHEQAVMELQQQVDQTIRDIRSLTFQLRPPILSAAGLVAAVRWFGEELKNQHGLDVKIEHDARPIALPYEKKSALFQVIRELLINVAKHAGTNHAVVAIKTVERTLHIVVTDDGVGCDPSKALAKHDMPDGFGLFNTHKMIEHLGGQLVFESIPGEGCLAAIRIPLSSRIKEGPHEPKNPHRR